MSWKDQYVAQYGSKIGVKASEPESWAERYKKRLKEYEAEQETQDEAAKKRKAALALANDMASSAYLAELDRQKREEAAKKDGSIQNPLDAQKRSYQYAQSANDYLQQAQDLRDYYETLPKYSMERSDGLRALDEALARVQQTGQALTSEADYWKTNAPILEQQAQEKKAREEYLGKATSAQKLLQNMTEDNYLAMLDADKRKAAGYQNPYDAEKTSYQFGQQASDYQRQVAEALDYLQQNTGETEKEKSLQLFRPYTENAKANRELVGGLEDQAAQLGTTTERLAQDAEYWKQYQDKDAYDMAMRQLEIENRKKEQERQAQIAKQNEAYTEEVGAGLTQGLPVTAFLRDQTNRNAVNNAKVTPDASMGGTASVAQINPETRNIGLVNTPYSELPDYAKYAAQGAALQNKTPGTGLFGSGGTGSEIKNKVTYGRENAAYLGASAFIGGSKSEETKYAIYRFMTDAEVSDYNYLLAKMGEATADQYLQSLNLNERNMANFKEATASYAEKNPVAASLFSVGAAPLAGTAFVAEGVGKLLGNDVDVNDPMHGLSNFQSVARGTIANNIKEKYGDVASFLYQTGMSIGDNAMVMLSTGGSGWLGGGLLGMNAAESTMLDAKRRGATDEQALLSGMWAGAAEMVFEKISIDSFVSMTKAGRGTFIKNVLKQSGIEASEEYITQIADALGDKLIMGDKSTYELAKKQYMAQGMSAEEAANKAALDFAKDVGLAALGGAVSGGLFGAGGSALGAINQSVQQNVKNQAGAPAAGNVAQNQQTEGNQRSYAEDYTDRMIASSPIGVMDPALKGYTTDQTQDPLMELAMQVQAQQEADRAARSTFGRDAADGKSLPAMRRRPPTIEEFRKNPEMYTEYSNMATQFEKNAREYHPTNTEEFPQAPAFLQDRNNYKMTDTAKAKNAGNPSGSSLDAMWGQFGNRRPDAYSSAFDKSGTKYGTHENVEKRYSKEAFYALDYDAVTHLETAMPIMDAMAKRAGVKIRIVDSIDHNGKQSAGNAKYNAADGVIDIALDAQDGAYEYIATHEMVHHVKANNAVEYDVLADVVTSVLTANGENVDALVQEEMKRNGYDEQTAREEVIANSIPAILNDETTVRRLVETDRNLAQRIADFIKQMLADIRAVGAKLAKRQSWKQMDALMQDTKSLREIGDLFIAALDDSKVMAEQGTQNGEQDTPFSLKTDESKQDIKSDATSINASKLPAVFSKVKFQAGTVNLDIGGGRFDNATEFLSRQGVKSYIYDPYNRSEEHNQNSARNTEEGKSDTVTISNVLNVIKEQSARDEVLENAVDALKPNGTAYITVYEGDQTGKSAASSKGWQENRTLRTYVAEVSKYFDDVSVKNGVIVAKSPIKPNVKTSGVRFSLKDVEPDISVDALVAENEQLKQANVLLQEQLKLTNGNTVDRADIAKVARVLKREFQSDIDYDTLTDNLEQMFGELSKTDNPAEVWQDVQRSFMGIGNQVIEKSSALDKTMAEHYAPIRERLKGTRVTLNDSQKAEAASISGNYGAYRKRMFGMVNLTNEGTPLDTIWQELSDIAPDLFPADVSDVDMPGYLMDAVEMMRPQYVNPYEMDRQEAANDVMMKAFQAYMELPKVRTFADKQKAKYEAQLDKYRAMMEKYRNDVKAKYDERLKSAKQKSVLERTALAQRIREEANARTKDRLRKQYQSLASGFHERLEQNRARYAKWVNNDRARERYLPRVEKTVKELADWLMKPTDAKHVPEKLKGVVNGFVSALDFAGEKTTKNADEWRERMRDLKDAMQEIENGDYENLNFYAEIDPDFVPTLKEFMDETAGVRNVRDLDGRQLTKLDYLVSGVKRSVTYANRLQQNARYQTVAEAAERSMAELDERKEAKQLGKYPGMARDLLNADQLDSTAYGDQLGAAGGSLIHELRNGLDIKVNDVRKTEEYTKGLIGKTDLKYVDNEKQTFTVTGGKVELTKAEIMSLYCLNKREQAKGHIYDGGIRTQKMSRPVKVSAEDVSSIIATLSAEEKRIADGIQEYMSKEVSGWGNEVSMNLYGYEKFTETSYFPIKSDENYVRSTDDENKGEGFYRLKNLGMTKSTVKGAKNALVLSGIMDVFTKHIDDMSSYHGFVIPISDAMKYFNYKGEAGSMKESIARALGYGGKKYFTTLIKDINGVKMETGKDIGETLLRNAKIAAVGANLRVVIQQPTAYLRAMNVISPKYLMQGLAKLPSIAKAKQFCAIAKWKSYGFYDLDIGKGLKEILMGSESAGQKVRNAALMPAQMADEMTWGYLWNAAEYETKAKRPELDVRSNAFNEAVGERLSEIVDRTQVVDSVFHRSQIMRRKGFSQFFTTFMSEPTKTYNMVRTAIAEAARNPKDKAAQAKLVRALSTYTLTGIFTAAASALIDAVRDTDKDEEGNPRSYQTKYGKAFGSNVVDILSPLNMIPYLREIQNLSQGFKPNRLDMRGVEFVWNAAVNWQKWFSGNTTKSVYGLVYQSAQGFSYLTGVPASNAMRAFEEAYYTLTGNTIDKENETATAEKSYSNLYKAYISGNKTKAKQLRDALRNGTSTLKPKTPAEIDTGIAEQLMLNDARIVAAYDARSAGNAREVLKIKNELIREGFTGEMVDKAIDRYGAVSKPQNPGNIDKELNVRLFSNEDMANAIVRAATTGDEESMKLVYSELLADSTAKDPAGAIKSGITENIKPIYLSYYDKGDDKSMLAIEMLLMQNFGYESKEFTAWIKAYEKSRIN